MKYHFSSSLAFIFLILLTICSSIEAQTSTTRSSKVVMKRAKHTRATLTLNSFEKGGDGGGPSDCDGHYHSDKTHIVALSTRWYNHGKRCSKFITINGNGRSVKAKVVDECDSTRGCPNDIVDASEAVWKALGVKKNSRDYGEMKVYWHDS